MENNWTRVCWNAFKIYWGVWSGSELIFYLTLAVPKGLRTEFAGNRSGRWTLVLCSEAIDKEEQMKQIKTRLTHGEGIALDEFKSFFFFLNNLEDFTIAVHYYSLANERILIILNYVTRVPFWIRISESGVLILDIPKWIQKSKQLASMNSFVQ